MKIQSRLKGATAPIALCIALLAQPAFAQETDEPEQQDTPAEEVLVEESDTDSPSATEGQEGGNQIFVTGSRIRRDEFSAPAPITIVDPELAVKSGQMDTASMILGSPISSGSSQVTDAISSNFLTNGGTGAQTISLRGLGAERTLVLLNGRRAGPAGTRGGVSSFDLNVLPQSIVERVDILKDGASSIYGSDAVAGVVNLITKTDTDGIEMNVFGSLPYASGGEEFSASATWGKTFDRGHLLISGSYQKRKELARGDRRYLGCTELYGFTDDTYTTRADLIDPRTGNYQCVGESNSTWGHIWTYDYTYYYGVESNMPRLSPNNPTGDGDVYLLQYNYAGDNLQQYLSPFPAATMPGQIRAADGWYITGIDEASESVQNNFHPRRYNDSIIPEADLYTLYIDGAYEVTDFAEFYVEGLYNKRKNYVNSSGQVYTFGLGEAVFNGPGYGGPDDTLFGFSPDPLAVGFSGVSTFSPTGFTDLVDSEVEVDYYRAVAGFRGDITSRWGYDIYGQYAKSDGTYRNQTALIDAMDQGTFRTGSCEGTVVSPGTPIERPCVDIDWFSPRVMYGDYTPEEYAFLFAWDEGNTTYVQKYAEAIVTGEAFDLPWSGPIGVALGATIREDSINDTPGYLQLNNLGFHLVSAGVTAGKSITKEAFGEVEIPLLQDLPLIRSLTFTGAARVTNVKATRASDGFSDTNNGNWTYKLGLDWEVTDFLRFRGTYGTSYRAPALFEQFLADQVASVSGWRDPCNQLATNLANGDITQQRYDNCVADGIPLNLSGGGIQPVSVTGGGIGVLEPETSKAWTASVILTPDFGFLPNTDVSLAVDYFNIEVNGEIAQLTPATIVYGCYDSEFYPDEPLCDLFQRVRDLDPSSPYWNAGSPDNVAVIFNSFLNINSQTNRGVDVTTRIVHDFGGDTTLTLQGQMTWQLEDEIALFSGFPEDNNGEIGEPKFVGDFNVQLDTGPWNLFYGLDVIGSGDSRRDYLDRTIGTEEDGVPISTSNCRTFTVYPTPICAKMTAKAKFYHNVAITREIGEMFTLTVGITNLLNTRAPRVTELSGSTVNVLGKGVLSSQYDLRGRRAFMNINVKL